MFRKVGPAPDEAIATCCANRSDIYFVMTPDVGLKLRDAEVSCLELKYCVERTPSGVEKWKKKVFSSLPRGCVTHVGGRHYALAMGMLPAMLGAAVMAVPCVRSALDSSASVSSVVIAKNRTHRKGFETVDVVVMTMDHSVPPMLYHSVCFEGCDDKNPEALVARSLAVCFTPEAAAKFSDYTVMGFPLFVLSAVTTGELGSKI